jgi:hypothetical protein
MKKTLVSFTISFACLIGFCKFANADMLPSWKITTENSSDWKVAKLLQSSTLRITGTKAEIKDTVFKNYVNGFSTAVNSNRTLSEGAGLTYENVKNTLDVGNYSDDYFGSNNKTITASDAKTGVWLGPGDPRNGDPRYGDPAHTYSTNALYPHGFYAFKTEFSLPPETADLSGLFLNIDLDILADDYLEGIFLNGHEITKYSNLDGVKGQFANAITTLIEFKTLDLTGSVLLDDLIAQGLFLTDGPNTLEFIILNGNYNGTSIEADNPFRFGAFGDIDIGDQEFGHSFITTTTPEPATLLICLTCGGLALAIRRRKNKKTVEM